MSLAPEPLGIEGAWQAPLKILPAAGGPVLRFLRAGELNALFPNGLAEIYFSEILPGSVKAWKLHERQNSLFCVPSGLIRLVLHDSRLGSPTKGTLLNLRLGRPDHYAMIHIPAGVWHGFQCLGAQPAIVCNCADLEHDDKEGRRLPPDDPAIPCAWPTA